MRLVDIDASFGPLPCCGVKSRKHPGRAAKECWLEAQQFTGLRARVLCDDYDRPAGYLETVPAESAWRAVHAPGYLFIHCIWIHSRAHQKRGLGRMLLDAAIQDAREQQLHGVAVLTRQGPWLAGPDLYLRSRFEPVAAAPPDYQLLVRKFTPAAPDPALPTDWDHRLRPYRRGLTIIRSAQCPHIAKFAEDIAAAARATYGIEPHIVDLQSPAEAQAAPTPYAVFAILHNGKILADHQISRTRFHNIMKKL